MRKKAKRTRYALEAIAPVTGKDIRRLADRVRGIQDVLGDHHDAVVATAWLRDAAVSGDVDPSVAFTAGQLADTFIRDAGRLRTRWSHTWRTTRADGRDAL